MFLSPVCRMDAVAELNQCVDSGMEKLVGIWDDIGIVGEQRSARNRVVLMHLGNLLDEMVREEDQLRTRLKQNVDKYRTEVTQLCTELCLPLYEVCGYLFAPYFVLFMLKSQLFTHISVHTFTYIYIYINDLFCVSFEDFWHMLPDTLCKS